jgi:ribonucleoside-diphosphate reductase alpha chain
MRLNNNDVPMNKLPYKIMLDRYAQKDMQKECLSSDDVYGHVVVAITDDSDPVYPQKEVCKIVSNGEYNDYYVVQNIYDVNEVYTLHKDKIIVPTELYPEEIWKRQADAMAEHECKIEGDYRRWFDYYYELLRDWKFVPGGRIMASLGGNIDTLASYNCFVLPSPADSRQGLVHTLGEMIEIMSRGGGVGINLSTLRPRNAFVKGVNGTSSGAVSWGGGYSYYTGLIEQGGSRRGALLLGLGVWHPDVIEFITAKQDQTKITNANVSILITEAFMEALSRGERWKLRFPDTNCEEYKTQWDGNILTWEEKCLPVIVYREIDSQALWDMIIQSAWKSGEPGIIWLERYNKLSNTWYYEDIIATNPCGEVGLSSYGVCNLGHINLSTLKLSSDGINWFDLEQRVHKSVRFLDNIIDIAFYFIDENKIVQKRSRRIGLGTMGLAELMIKLGIRYGSEDSLKFIDTLYAFIRNASYDASVMLAKERGPFPAYDYDNFIKGSFIQGLPESIKEKIQTYGIRNATLLTQAPTGTGGTMCETSTGIEPFYQWKYIRMSRLGKEVQYARPAQKWLIEHGYVDLNGNPRTPNLENLDINIVLPNCFVTALELTPQEHIEVMARIQRYVDCSISKTVNCPNDWNQEQVGSLYLMAYSLGCKGVTVYRDGSRESQVLSKVETVSENVNQSVLPDPLQAEDTALKWGDKIKIPKDTIYSKVKFKTGCGKIILMIGYSKSLNMVVDVYTIVNSAGGCQLNIQGLAITISECLRHGGDIEKLYHNSQGAGNCGSYQYKRGSGQKDLYGKSCFNAMIKAILDFKNGCLPEFVQVTGCDVYPKQEVENVLGLDVDEGKFKCDQKCYDCNFNKYCGNADYSYMLKKKEDVVVSGAIQCPSCKKQTLITQTGCYQCTDCGYTKCE